MYHPLLDNAKAADAKPVAALQCHISLAQGILVGIGREPAGALEHVLQLGLGKRRKDGFLPSRCQHPHRPSRPQAHLFGMFLPNSLQRREVAGRKKTGDEVHWLHPFHFPYTLFPRLPQYAGRKSLNSERIYLQTREENRMIRKTGLRRCLVIQK